MSRVFREIIGVHCLLSPRGRVQQILSPIFDVKKENVSPSLVQKRGSILDIAKTMHVHDQFVSRDENERK